MMQWGLPAIEAYLVTRYHMYQQVYFHKVNTLTQTYLRRLLVRARELAIEGKLDLTPAMRGMLLDDELTVAGYARLTDVDILAALPDWGHHDDDFLREDALRLLRRRGYHKLVRVEGMTIGEAKEMRPNSVLGSGARARCRARGAPRNHLEAGVPAVRAGHPVAGRS